MSDYMHDDVLTKILAYLPPKSLVRFTCVCKSWQSLITSSDFITDHLNQSRLSATNDGRHLLLLRYYPGKPEEERSTLHVDNETFEKYQTLDFPLQTSKLSFRVLGSCNGLVCLSDDYYHKTTNFILWNPTVRKSVKLPVFDGGPCDDFVGFGFDSRSNDYKVIRVGFLDSVSKKSRRVEVFKLSTGSWETIAATIEPSYTVYDYHLDQVFLNGAIHWCGFERGDRDVIMAFDTSDDVFRVLKLPRIDVRTDLMLELPIAKCGEWLSFFNYYWTQYHRRCCNIWVMKEYGVLDSWSKLYTVDLSGGGLSKLLNFRINGDIIIAMTNTRIVSYNPRTHQTKYLAVCDPKKDFHRSILSRFVFYVGDFVESLVLLGYRPNMICAMPAK